MRFWFDTEFIDDGHTIDLISIGIVSEDDRHYYAEFYYDADKANAWVQANVLPHLQGVSRDRNLIRLEIIEFMGEKPEIWGYYSAYDWVALCQLFGSMMDLPKGWPKWCRDLKQLCSSLGNPHLPAQKSVEHHALADAIWIKEGWQYLQQFRTAA